MPILILADHYYCRYECQQGRRNLSGLRGQLTPNHRGSFDELLCQKPRFRQTSLNIRLIYYLVHHILRKQNLISWKTGSLIAKSYFLRFVKTNFCAHGFGKNIGKTCSFFSVPTKIFKASYGPLSWCMPSFYFLPWLLNFVLYDVMTISAPSYN